MSRYQPVASITRSSVVKFLPLKLVLVTLLLCLMLIRNGVFQRIHLDDMINIVSQTNFSRVGSQSQNICQQVLGNQQTYPETPYVYFYCVAPANLSPLVVKPYVSNCSGFDCWESQLTDASKVEILRIMNSYRSKVAENKCKKWCKSNEYRVIYELRWNYDIEQQALNMIRSCSRETVLLNQKIIRPGYDQLTPGGTTIRDVVLVTFATRTGLQREMRKILWKLMNENYLHDWNETTSKFRRGEMIDFGCAYILRRNVDVNTSLGEEVRSGNVGHLACVFFAPVFALNPKKGPPNRESCLATFPWSSQYIVLNNASDYFPSLCRGVLSIDTGADLDCVFSDFEFCDSSHPTKNPVTWRENPYGFSLMSNIQRKNPQKPELNAWNTTCNYPKDIPIANKEGPDIYNYNCTLKQEVHVQADSKLCSNWNCEDSQLRDVTRLNILKSLNHNRQLVANGQCSTQPSSNFYCTGTKYCNMANVRWHWFLEEKASEIVKPCSNQEAFKEEQFDDEPFHGSTVYESISLVFDLPAARGQTALEEIFSKLFWKNAFNDWDDAKVFRRGNALWIGCSIIQRPNTTIPEMNSEYKLDDGVATHMTCIYAALNDRFVATVMTQGPCCQTCDPKMVTSSSPCQVYLVPNIAPFYNLCTSILLEITMNCEVNYCEKRTNTSTAWKTSYKGVTIFQHVNGSFIAHVRPEPITTTTPEPSTKPTPATTTPPVSTKKYCRILLLISLVVTAVFVLFISLVFKYFSEQKTFQSKKP